MIRGKENLIQWARFTDSIYWTVKGDKNVIGARDSNAPADLDQSMSELETLLGFLDPGKYYFDGVKAVNEATAKKHVAETFLIVGDDAKSNPQPQNNQGIYGFGGMYGPDQIEAMVERKATQMAEKFKLESKIERLEEENKRLKGESPLSRSDQAWATVIETVGPQLPAIIAGIMNQNAATQQVSGAGKKQPQKKQPQSKPVDPSHDVEIEEEEAAKITNAIAQLYQWDSDTPAILEKLALVSKNNPDKLRQVLPILDQFIQ